MAGATGSDEAQVPDPAGLGGWLNLLFAGLVLSMFASSISLWVGYEQLLPAWSLFSTGQTALLLALAVVDVVVGILVPAVLIFLFLRKSKKFPGVFIIWSVAMPMLAIIEPLLYPWVFGPLQAPDESMFDAETRNDILRSLFWAGVGIAYIYRSDRVSNTFVN